MLAAHGVLTCFLLAYGPLCIFVRAVYDSWDRYGGFTGDRMLTNKWQNGFLGRDNCIYGRVHYTLHCIPLRSDALSSRRRKL